MSGCVLGTSASLFAVMCSHPHFIDEELESQRDVRGLLVPEVWNYELELQLGTLWLQTRHTLLTILEHKWVFALCIYISAVKNQSPGSENGLAPTCYNPHRCL